MRKTGSVQRVMKAELTTEPVHLTYPEQVIAQARDQSEEIIEEAQKASERIRRSALQGAERERLAARKEAAELIEAAKREREKLFQETCEAARTEAETKVMEEFRPRLEANIASFEEIVWSTEESLKDCLERHKGELVELAVRIAERVILRQTAEDRDLVYRTACAALEKARERQNVILYANPDDLAVLEEYQADLISRFDDLKSVRIEIDRRVDKGGVRVETSSGMIDARIRTQVDEIIKGILQNAQSEDA